MTELIIIDNKLGDGDVATRTMEVLVHYTGWLYDEDAPDHKGQQFDSSHNRCEPLDFMLGVGHVISGWDQGLEGMKVGGQRTLIIPSELGYGRQGAGNAIPPDAALVFDVELLAVRE